MGAASQSVDTSMFSLKSKHTLEKPIHNNDFIKYSLSSLATINNNNSNISISLPRRCIHMFATLIHKCRIRST